LKIALFLGAGASVPLGKPVTVDFKEILSHKVDMQSISYWFIHHYGYNDVEEVLQAIRDTKDFWEGYGCKYLRHIYRLVIKDSSGKEISFEDYINELSKLEKIIHDEVFNVYRWNLDYDGALKKIYSKLLDFMKESSEKIMIFTTNYDRALEEYCGRINDDYHCDDGFRLYTRTEKFYWDGHGKYEKSPLAKEGATEVFLHKLHGSLNWKEHKGDVIEIERTSEEGRPNDKNYSDSILIFPTLTTKDRHQLKPFKSIREEFAQYMKEADVCIVIGFSFRDNHLKEIFTDFITEGKKFIVISPKAKSDYNDNLLVSMAKTSDGRDETIRRGFVRGTTHVSFIENKLTSENVKKIIHDIQRIIEPEKHLV